MPSSLWLLAARKPRVSPGSRRTKTAVMRRRRRLNWLRISSSTNCPLTWDLILQTPSLEAELSRFLEGHGSSYRRGYWNELADCRGHNRDFAPNSLTQFPCMFHCDTTPTIDLGARAPVPARFCRLKRKPETNATANVYWRMIEILGVLARRRGGCVEIKLAGHAWGLKRGIARVTAAMSADGNGLCYRAVSAVGNSRGRQRT